MRSKAYGLWPSEENYFLFVGSERAGRAAAIYYSLVESCKLNKVNPLTYLNYVLNKRVALLDRDSEVDSRNDDRK
jgi:hypothetical protein